MMNQASGEQASVVMKFTGFVNEPDKENPPSTFFGG